MDIKQGVISGRYTSYPICTPTSLLLWLALLTQIVQILLSSVIIKPSLGNYFKEASKYVR